MDVRLPAVYPVPDDGISSKVESPEIHPQRFFGKECIDKVTHIKGMCIGRYIWLFNCDQYVLEFRPEEKSLETKYNILDEGRVEVLEASCREITPEDVASPRPGGVFLDYPAPDVIM